MKTTRLFSRIPRHLVLLQVLLIAVGASAQEKEIPQPLEPWQGWVLWDQQDADSPRPFNSYNQPIRVWPSRLDLTAAGQGGQWQLDVRVFDEAWVALPGDAKAWPQNVRDGETPVPVVQRAGGPAVKLAAGTHQLSGEFRWSNMPQRIAVPRSIGLLSLMVNYQEVAIPSWDSAGQVWLKRTSVEPAQKDLLSAKVYRVIEDGIPLWLRTEIELTVSGKSREEELGNVLPEGWRLSYVESPIPVAIDNRGRVKVQVRAGKWKVMVHAFRNTPLQTLRFAEETKPITAMELIGFRSKPDFRVAELEGATQIDVSQTTFPADWRSLPVYQWASDSELRLVEKQRGMGDQGHEGLAITRQLWLDEDGSGFTYRDSVTGRMQQLWRLDASAGQELSAVRANGDPQLITTNPTSDLPGVEIRDRNLNLDAVGRVDRGETMSAVGWQADVDSLEISFALPPGWRMIALLGADDVRGDWLTAWTLLDLFLLLVFSVAVFKLWGFPAGLIALLAFGLSYHEPFSPRFTWFFLLIPVALLRVVPQGTIKRLINVWKWAALVLLLLCFVPFTVWQIQTALYPQLEASNAYYGLRVWDWQPGMAKNAEFAAQDYYGGVKTEGQYDPYGESEAAELDGAVAPPTPMAPQVQEPSRRSMSLGVLRIEKGQKLPTGNMVQMADARVQTGCAVPQWGGREVTCSWSGRVTSGQEIRPVLLSSQMHRALTVVKLLLLLLLGAILLGVARIRFPLFPRETAAAAVVLAMLLPAGESHAQIPDATLLETLRKRLTASPDAFPHAADISSLDLKLTDGRITMTAEVHAATKAAVPMPGKLPSWSPLSITVDGEPSTLVCRRQDGYLWVTVPSGVHTVSVEGLLAETSEWEFTYLLPPRLITIDAPGWNVTGISPDGVPGKQAFFAKQEKRVDGQASYDQKNFRAVAAVERRLEVGLIWKVSTTVRRLSAPGKAVSLRVPLLPDESVLSGNLDVKEGKVAVNLAAGQNEFTWESELAQSGRLELQADASADWIEMWRLATSPVWNVSFDGLPPIYHAGESTLTPEWRPWPGESVTLALTRPKAVPGETMTVQSVSHKTTHNARERETSVKLEVESSLGGDFVIDFDPDAEVRSLSVGGVKQIARRDGRQLIVPLRPGKQVIDLNYITSAELATTVTADEIKLPVEAANVSTSVRVPADRWVLWAQGPLRGPAIQFWVILICSVVAALVLGSLPISPLGRLEWVLLLIGLTQVPLAAAMFVIAWLLLLAWRRRLNPDEVSFWSFDLLQIGIVFVTVVSLGILIAAVGEGLLDNPEMFIVGNGSSRTALNWFEPRTGVALPQPVVVGVSVWFYRLLMLLWALWLAVALLRWLQMGWAAFSQGGFWRLDLHSKAPVVANQPADSP